MVQEETPAFVYVQNCIAEALKGEVHEKVLKRIIADPKLSIATLTRNASVAFALRAFKVSRFNFVDDKDIRRDQQFTDRLFRQLDKKGIPYETHWNQNSKDWKGLQLADIVATILHRRCKIIDQFTYFLDHGLPINLKQFNRFDAEVIKQKTISLLEIGKRTLRAVDLQLADE